MDGTDLRVLNVKSQKNMAVLEMKIIDKLAALGPDEPYFSLEFFPPKTDMVFYSPCLIDFTGFCEPPAATQSYGSA